MDFSRTTNLNATIRRSDRARFEDLMHILTQESKNSSSFSFPPPAEGLNTSQVSSCRVSEKTNRYSNVSLDPLDPYDTDVEYRRHVNNGQVLSSHQQIDHPEWSKDSESSFLRVSVHFNLDHLLCLGLRKGSHLLVEFDYVRLLLTLFLMIVLPYGLMEFMNSGHLSSFFMAYPRGLLSFLGIFFDSVFWILEWAI